MKIVFTVVHVHNIRRNSLPKIWNTEDDVNNLTQMEEAYYTYGAGGETQYIDADGNICKREEE